MTSSLTSHLCQRMVEIQQFSFTCPKDKKKKRLMGQAAHRDTMTDDSSVGPCKGDKFQDLAADLRFGSYIRSWDRIGSLCTGGK